MKPKAHAAVRLSNQGQINLSVRLGLNEEGGHFGGLGNTDLSGLKDWYRQEFGERKGLDMSQRASDQNHLLQGRHSARLVSQYRRMVR